MKVLEFPKPTMKNPKKENKNQFISIYFLGSHSIIALSSMTDSTIAKPEETAKRNIKNRFIPMVHHSMTLTSYTRIYRMTL
jgi:hypothetical protein